MVTLHTARWREIRNYARAVLAVMGDSSSTLEQAKREVARLLGCAVPGDLVFNAVLNVTVAKRVRGRRTAAVLPKGEAVAAMAVYFESLGAGVEQAIIEAKRWLGVTLSRRVAKDAIQAYRANTSRDQFAHQAIWAYGVFKPGTTLPLPTSFTKPRRRKQTKSDLG